MRLVLHPKVYSDIDEIMGYYERVAPRELADEFCAELRHSVIGVIGVRHLVIYHGPDRVSDQRER
jgi:hypothetical protein